MIGKIILPPTLLEDRLNHDLGNLLYKSPMVSVKGEGLLQCFDKAFSAMEQTNTEVENWVTHMITSWSEYRHGRCNFGKIVMDEVHMPSNLDSYDFTLTGYIFTSEWYCSDQMGNKTLLFGENGHTICCELDYADKQ